MQHWYWYPLMNFMNLALTPTALIGLNKSLKVPKSFKCTSNAKASTYKYPEFIKLDKDKKKEKVVTAVLSTTTKAKARKDRKDGKTTDIDVASSTSPKKGDADKEMTNEEKAAEEEKKEAEVKEAEPEQDFQELKNPSRILKQQETKISYSDDVRYKPVLETRFGGFVILREINPPAEGEEDKEEFYDDEERDQDAPNPDLQTDMKLPEPFEFDPEI